MCMLCDCMSCVVGRILTLHVLLASIQYISCFANSRLDSWQNSNVNSSCSSNSNRRHSFVNKRHFVSNKLNSKRYSNVNSSSNCKNKHGSNRLPNKRLPLSNSSNSKLNRLHNKRLLLNNDRYSHKRRVAHKEVRSTLLGRVWADFR